MVHLKFQILYMQEREESFEKREKDVKRGKNKEKSMCM
jgi:hypothetical protein